MSRAELATGEDPELRQLATEIISAQEKEIALIDRWLKKYEKSKGRFGEEMNLRGGLIQLCRNYLAPIRSKIP